MALLLTVRDLEILEVLTRRIRVLTIHQIARTWWPDSTASGVAHNRIRKLGTEGLLHFEGLPAHPELAFINPEATWTPGDDEPKFGAVSYRLQSRWKEHPVLTSCVSATKRAADRFGGYGGRPPRAVERTHDLHMARVFLLYRERFPEDIKNWIFEEQVKAERKRDRSKTSEHASSTGSKLPDAFLRSESGSKVIEFGGAYDADKLAAFHGYCKEHTFPYEIW